MHSLMECNKEEAERCKAISEANFKRHDLVGAKKYALKATQLFPELEGLPQLSSILDVHIAAHQKLRTGESNYYGTLQVDFRADDNIIRKQYRKLALVLHPDKNKAFGAEAAFKHISEAWSVLSDKDKKLGFDKRWCEHMAARATHPSQNPDNLRSSRVPVSRVNINKSSNVNWAHQGQTHVQPQQGAYVHRQQGQYIPQFGQVHAHQKKWQGHTYLQQGQRQAHVPQQQGQSHISQQQGQGQAHASPLQQQGQAHAPAFKQYPGRVHQQQGQRQAHVPQQQGQGQAHTSQQQGQSQAHASPLQQQGQAHAPQQQERDQARAFKQYPHIPQQQGQGQAHTSQQQGQGQAHASPLQQQGQAHAPQQQERDQACAFKQQSQSQSQGHVHQQQGQGESYVHRGQGQSDGHDQQEQGKVHVQHQQGQGPRHSHQQQGQVTMQVQGQAHQARVPQKPQGQVHVHQQERQGPAHAHEQQGKDRTQAQGQAHQAPVPLNDQVFVNKPSQPAFQHSKSTFWTACPSCRMQIEYERAHMNKNLCCPMCYKAFVSKEIAPVQGAVLWPPPISLTKPDLKTDAGIKIGIFDSNSDPVPRADSTLPATMHSNKKAKIGTEENLLRHHGQQKPPEAPAQPAQKPGLRRLEKDKLRKRVALHAKEGLERLIARSKGVIAQKLSEEKERKAAADKASAIGQNKKADNERSAFASGPSIQNKPVASEKECHVHSTEEREIDTDACNPRSWTQNLTEPCKEARVSHEGSKSKPVGTGVFKVEALQRKRKLASPMDKSIEDQNEGVSNFIKEFKSYRGSEDREASDVQLDDVDFSADKCRMEVPDPDFHNFDGDRTEEHFASGQIWASYDDDDGMPRYYGRVNKILSRQPLKMQMNWLEARSPSDETLAWLVSGFQHSCGDFKLGNMYIAEEVSTFSHLMAVDKGPRRGFKIYPRQGDVWAVYKDWEILKVKEDKRGYDMVEIAAAFDEEKGLQVSPLFKVAGFKTIFERKAGEDHVKWIPPQELRRLSHQVPAHRIVAGEVPRIQVDCLELDPASTPLDLIYGKQQV